MSDGRRSLAGRAAAALGAYAADARARRNRLVDAGAPALAERLYRLSDRVAYTPFRGEVNEVPPAVEVEGVTLDVAADLAAYTGLPRAEVESLLARRNALSFRSEWWATPEPLRRDQWFYLSSKTYLFANAVHFPDASFVDRFVAPYVPPGGRVLDFGGGAGGLTLTLAARGLEASYTDLNALQRDFVRFRVHRLGLGERVRLLDWWDELPAAAFDAIVAVDVLEHLEDGRETVASLLAALSPTGVLVEDSPFEATAANPMHHEDFGLREQLAAGGLGLVLAGEAGINVWRRGG